MNSPASPSDRRRRRIAVLTIAALALGLGWWFWPRVDQRFVGTWTRNETDRYSVWTAAWTFHPDGRLDIRTKVSSASPEFTSNYRWFVIGNRFFQLREESVSEKPAESGGS